MLFTVQFNLHTVMCVRRKTDRFNFPVWRIGILYDLRNSKRFMNQKYFPEKNACVQGL